MIRLAIAALLCLSLLAQTRVEPWQIRDWRQVAPLVGTRAGTQVAVEQLRIDPAWIAAWRTSARRPGPDCYEVAMLMDQPEPVLITRGGGDYKFWFRTRWDGAIKGE